MHLNLRRQKILEALAVIASLAYTLLYTYEIIWCWLFAALSAGIYLYLCFLQRIYAESLLQIFYLYTAWYGWQNWGMRLTGEASNLNLNTHGIIVLSGLGLVIISGFLLKRLSDAATPYVDAFTTIFSIFATILMVNFFPSNWLYWIVIDGVSVYLYYHRRLYLTAGLFFLYTLLAINGYFTWVNI